MKFSIRLLFAILIIFFGYHAIRVETGGYEVGIFSVMSYIHFVLVIIFTAIALSLDISAFKLHRKIYHLAPGLLGIAIIIFVIFKVVQRNMIDSLKTTLLVTNLPGARNVWTFEFKENSRFVLADRNLFGQTFYYGRYVITKDTILVKQSNYDGTETDFPKKGIIRNDTVFWVGSDTMLIKTNN